MKADLSWCIGKSRLEALDKSLLDSGSILKLEKSAANSIWNDIIISELLE